MFQGRSRDWTRLAEDTKGGRSRAATPKGCEGRGVLDEPGAGEAIIGARVGIFWEDDETFYKASSSVCTMLQSIDILRLSIRTMKTIQIAGLNMPWLLCHALFQEKDVQCKEDKACLKQQVVLFSCM